MLLMCLARKKVLLKSWSQTKISQGWIYLLSPCGLETVTNSLIHFPEEEGFISSSRFWAGFVRALTNRIQQKSWAQGLADWQLPLPLSQNTLIHRRSRLPQDCHVGDSRRGLRQQRNREMLDHPHAFPVPGTVRNRHCRTKTSFHCAEVHGHDEQ